MAPAPRWRARMPTRSQLFHKSFLVLFVGVVVSALYRYIWLDTTDPFKCEALKNGGRWLDPPQGPYLNRPYQNWQPEGCVMHEYKSPDIRSCLEHKRLVFAGDSTVRQLFWAVAKKLDKGKATKEKRLSHKHRDLEFAKNGVELKFLWDPYLNSSTLHDELEAFSGKKSGDGKTEGASLMLIGAGLWFARHIPLNTQKAFKDAIDSIVPYAASSPREMPSNLASGLSRGVGPASLVFAPVMVPYYDKLSPSRELTLTPEKIDPMNEYLQQLSVNQGVEVLWSYAEMMSIRSTYAESGIHVIENVAIRKADVLLNLKCNAQAQADGHFPYNRTCCSNYTSPNWVQWVFLLGGGGLLPVLNSIGVRDRRLLPSARVLRAAMIFAAILCYCFYADRTQIFNKIQKQYVSKEFLTLSGFTLLLGILSIRRSSVKLDGQGKPADQPMLSRDQTEEWKGWMQFGILIYHLTGASQVLWIYEIIRLLVASYLFMTGFGHTIYFYTKRDYSLRRVASVLIRLNLLSCTLPYVMHTDYLFYYFAPLVSFWFLVVYATMRIGHERNKSPLFLIGKIVCSAILVTLFTKVPHVLEVVFTILRYTCRIHWDVNEWRFRVFLDMFIVYVGMLAAMLYVSLTALFSHHHTHAYTKKNALLARVKPYLPLLRALLILFALIILPAFWSLTRRSPDKYDYNWWQPYISFLPILAFVVLRNSHRHLRNFHSSIYAFIGRCSLETFTLQFHIWLAGDTRGLLSLGLTHDRGTDRPNRWKEFAAITVVFLWLSWCCAAATAVLTRWIVDGGDVAGPSAVGSATASARKTDERKRPMEEDDDDEEQQEMQLPLTAPAATTSTSSSTSTSAPANGNGYANGHAAGHHERHLSQSYSYPHSHSNAPAHRGGIPATRLGRLVRRWKQDLRVRILVLLGAMWVCNILYTS
ncbi:MAG: hypothetical protein M1819_001093 [Sarea resinae]|nr:MAG: hypothetical protein M1819_001093 [Sarea resinae]